MFETVLVLFGGLLLVLLAGTPIAFGFGFISILGILLFLSPDNLSQLANIAYTQATSSTMLIFPLFILMAEVLSCSNVAADLFDVIVRRLKKIPANLAVSTTIASAFFSAVCGSSTATAATLGTISIPAMLKNGYQRGFAGGLQAAAGTLGILIPPSMAFVLYGIITETSIVKLFMAGIFPGILLTLMLIATSLIMVKIKPDLIIQEAAVAIAEDIPKTGFSEDIAKTAPALVLITAVISFLYMGIATVTETAAIGSMGALLMVLAQKRINLDSFKLALMNTTRTSTMVLFLVIGGLAFSYVISSLGLPQAMSETIIDLSPNRWVTLVAVNILLIILGLFLEPMGMLIITLPFLFPTLTGLGFDPIWLGVIITINIEIGMITPPVGLNLFVLNKMGGLTMRDLITGVWPFVITLLLGIVLLTVFPQLSLYLPSRMN